MNESRTNKLMAAVRNAPTPEPPFSFSQNVITAIRRDGRKTSASLLDELGGLFPRIAFASLLVITLSVAGEWYLSQSETVSTADIEQVTEEWLYASR